MAAATLQGNYLKEAQSVYPLPFQSFDQDRYLLNCQNGTLDLRTMHFYEHRASDFLSKIAGASYLRTLIRSVFRNTLTNHER